MKRSGFLKRNTRLKAKSSNPSALVKESIQALLRAIVIQRDGGCILRDSEEAGDCGGYGSKSGQLILQAEHLHSRANSVSFGDLRLVVCLCLRHHFYFKKQYPEAYYRLIKECIGPERTALLEAVQKDHRPHRMTLYDWQKIEMFLKAKLASL